MEDGKLLTGKILQEKWQMMAEELKIPKSEWLECGEGWLTAFKKRTNLKETILHGKAASAPRPTVEAERQRIQELLAGYSLDDIYNADETGKFYA